MLASLLKTSSSSRYAHTGASVPPLLDATIMKQRRALRNPPDRHVHRAFSPSLGRFINRDPARELSGANLFTYSHNSPSTSSDPSGLSEGPWNAVNGFVLNYIDSHPHDDASPKCLYNYLKHSLAAAIVSSYKLPRGIQLNVPGGLLGGVYIELQELLQNYAGTVSNGIAVDWGSNTDRQQSDYAKFNNQLRESLSQDTVDDLIADFNGAVAAQEKKRELASYR